MKELSDDETIEAKHRDSQGERPGRDQSSSTHETHERRHRYDETIEAKHRDSQGEHPGRDQSSSANERRNRYSLAVKQAEETAPCWFLKKYLSHSESIKLLRILEVPRSKYDHDMSVPELCEVLEENRPDLMRPFSKNLLRGFFYNYHWKYLIAHATLHALSANSVGNLLLLKYVQPVQFVGLMTGLLKGKWTHGAVRSLYLREQARNFLGRDMRYAAEASHQRKYKLAAKRNAAAKKIKDDECIRKSTMGA